MKCLFLYLFVSSNQCQVGWVGGITRMMKMEGYLKKLRLEMQNTHLPRCLPVREGASSH